MNNNQKPIVEAHRGNSAYIPENTIAAFQSAIEINAEWIELDIHPTLDNELVVIHDSLVDRTTNGTGAVEELTLSEILQFDAGSWFDLKFSSERIPLLSEVIALVQPTLSLLNIEIKTFRSDANVAETLTKLLRETGLSTKYIVSSFATEALLQIKAIAPEIQLALIGEGPAILNVALKHNFQWIHARYDTIDQKLIDAANTAGIKVNSWTVDEPEIALKLAQYGIDKVCSNRPADIMAVLNS